MHCPLLTAQQGRDGTFAGWLERLGLKGFLSKYPLRQLVEWGWVVPQHRLRVPDEFFRTWSNFPTAGADIPAHLTNYSLLWECHWLANNPEQPLWFLHPFFHGDSEAGRLLRDEGAYTAGSPSPASKDLGADEPIAPYVDYFFHWQGFALIDVIRSADCISPIINTPDVVERAQGIVRIAEAVKDNDPTKILRVEKRWAGLAEPMTWLSHYRAFRSAVGNGAKSREDERSLRKRGAKQLADHLGIDERKLSEAIKDRMLVLAQDWRWANDRHTTWTLTAWPQLQRDIATAVEWLCYLNGRTIDSYLDEWRYNHFGNDTWAELHKVLPYGFFDDKRKFLELVPHYLKAYNALLPIAEKLEGEHLKATVHKLRSTNYPFPSFMGAFRQLHEELSHRFDEKEAPDLRELRPLDHYSVLAIRAEGCLRWTVDQAGKLAGLQQQSLAGYIKCLATNRKRLSAAGLQFFAQQEKKLTKLHNTPPDPIAAIMALTPPFDALESASIRGLLCCVLARNYFAHHHYLDAELAHSKESGFMLAGILITVLLLA